MFYNSNFTSANKYFLRRFNSNALRMMASCIAGTSLMFFMGIVLYGPALAISSVTDFSLWTTIITIGIICTFYTTIGGLKAVIWTDTIQMMIMLAGLIAVLIKISMDVGGIGEIWRISAEGDRLGFSSFQADIFNPVPGFYDSLLYGIIYWASVMSVTQTSFQRYCSMASLKDAKIILYLNYPGINVTAGLAALCGLALYAYYRHCDPILSEAISNPDQIMPYFVLEALNYGGIPGLFIACVFSSSLSTLSSGYTSLSAIVWGDFLKPWLKYTGKKELYTTKIIAACFGGISIAIAYLCSNVRSIIQAQAMLGSPFLTALFAVYISSTMIPFVNRKGAITGIICGMAWCLTIGIGSILNERSSKFLPTSVENCWINASVEKWNITTTYSMAPNVTTALNVTTTVNPYIIPSGVKQIFYLSAYWMPTLAFLVTLGCVIVASAVTGGAKYEPPVDPEYVYKPMLRICSWNLPPMVKSFLCPKILEKQEGQNESSDFQVNRSSTEVLAPVYSEKNTKF